MGFIADAIEDVGNFISDTVEAVVDNPIGALVSVGGMALGIPPIYAGALGGAANAAAHDGNVLEGALLGGAMGYVGGAAGNAAANAGAGSALSGAAGGAAAGALGSAITGGDIIKGALTGGVLGAGSGYIAGQVNNQDGTFTRTNDDGSVVRFNSNGDILQVSPATDGTPAPVYEWNPSTRQMELISSNGTNALNILDETQTADLMKNIDPRMINSLQDTGTFRVEVSGLPGTAENPGYANIDARTPGTDLANFDQIDAGQATWNPAANAWEITTPNAGAVQPGEIVTQPYSGSDTYTFDDGSTITIGKNGQATSTDATGNIRDFGGGNAYASEGGGTTYRFDDGSWMTINPDGSSIVADSDGNVTTHAGGTYTGSGNNGSTTDLGELEIVANRPTTGTPTLNDVIVTPTTPTTIPYNPVNTPTTATPVFPVITPTGPTTPTPTTSTGGGTTGTITPVALPGGLNPGWVAPTPFYNTTSPSQSQYYWGAHPFQSESTFNPRLYNMSNEAPKTPWGAQSIAQPLTPQEVTRAYQGQPIVRPPAPVATRVEQPLSSYIADHFYQQSQLPHQLVPPPTAVATTQGLPVQTVDFVTGPAVPA